MYKMVTHNILLIVICLPFVCARGEITRYEQCPDSEGVIKYFANFTKRNDRQFLNFNLTLPFPLDDKIGVKCTMQTQLVGNTFRTMHTIYEKNLCKAANQYMGEQWHNITRAAKIAYKSCPIRPGQYQGNNIELNLDDSPLRGFTFGKLRLILAVVNNSSPNVNLLCLLEEINYINKV